MSLFKNIFGANDEAPKQSKIEWRQLTDLGQLNEIIDLSNETAVLIFKHSTRCSISRMVLKQFENEFELKEQIIPYFLDLLNYRDISNAIASQFEVVHQSPQILLIKNGKVIFSTSHDDIDAKFLERFVI
ncbi:bacillithiol system redox-active protein YtxJ [Flavobacterium sp.]|uniref:bacillithiol system redox-active protein YtxJ n=1 Tax=Flavobacterium sp. TaxID=239 RepID=UPI002615CA1D|nr:bacillithiol system redox-active protein YtxJ [Flavobacterium sp.]